MLSKTEKKLWTALFLYAAVIFAFAATKPAVTYAEQRPEVRQEKECGYVLDIDQVRLGKTTAYITLELDGRTRDNFGTIDSAVCAFKVLYPTLGVRSVYVDQQNARQEAPVVLRDRVKGLLLLFNRN